MFKTKTVDWYFIIPATLVWLTALTVTARDFMQVQQATYRFGFMNLFVLGIMFLGVAIRVWARRTLGRHFSASLRTLDKHELITYGIYKQVRHPAYTSNFLFWFRIPFLFSSWYGFLVMLLLVPCILYRIKIEENMLIEKCGIRQGQMGTA